MSSVAGSHAWRRSARLALVPAADRSCLRSRRERRRQRLASCTPTTLVFPGTTTINCTLHVQTAPAVESASSVTRLSSPQSAADGSSERGRRSVSGREPTLLGPGTLVGGGSRHRVIAALLHARRALPRRLRSVGSLNAYDAPGEATTTSFVLTSRRRDHPGPATASRPIFILGRPTCTSGRRALVGRDRVFRRPSRSDRGVRAFGSLPRRSRHPLLGSDESRHAKHQGRQAESRSRVRPTPPLSRQKLRIFTELIQEGTRRAARGR